MNILTATDRFTKVGTLLYLTFRSKLEVSNLCFDIDLPTLCLWCIVYLVNEYLCAQCLTLLELFERLIYLLDTDLHSDPLCKLSFAGKSFLFHSIDPFPSTVSTSLEVVPDPL